MNNMQIKLYHRGSDILDKAFEGMTYEQAKQCLANIAKRANRNAFSHLAVGYTAICDIYGCPKANEFLKKQFA